MDKYGSEEEFNGGASPKKKKYSLRTVRANTNRYQPEINGDVSTKDRRLIRSSAISERNTRYLSILQSSKMSVLKKFIELKIMIFKKLHSF